VIEEEENNSEEAEETPAEEAPAEDAPVEDAPAEDAPAEDTPAEQAEEPAEEEPQPEADPADSGSEAEESAGSGSEPAQAPAAAAPAEEAEPEEVLTPKQIRRQKRSQHTGEAKPQRGTDERVAERAATRKAAAESRRRTRARARSKHTPGEGTPPAEHVKGSKKVRQGTVVSNKADKTITVRIELVRRHPQYEKIVRQTATIHAHDESNDANEGDVVQVIESRPLSRTKRWRLVEVLERAR
jgi:small subunit ribosomal protein S17